MHLSCNQKRNSLIIVSPTVVCFSLNQSKEYKSFWKSALYFRYFFCMVLCFIVECKHHFESHTCSIYHFPKMITVPVRLFVPFYCIDFHCKKSVVSILKQVHVTPPSLRFHGTLKVSVPKYQKRFRFTI